MFPHCLVKHSPSDTNRFLCSPPPVALILTILIFIQVETVHGCEEQAITESKQIDINLSIEKDDFPLQNRSVVLAAHRKKHWRKTCRAAALGLLLLMEAADWAGPWGSLDKIHRKKFLFLLGQNKTKPDQRG